jgi:TonB family protein
MRRTKSVISRVIAACLVVAVAVGSVPVIDAADAPGGAISGSTHLSGCRLRKVNRDAYPESAKLDSVSGRVLALVERSPEGRLKVIRIAISNPPETFDDSVRRFVESFECEPLEAARQFQLSVTFTMHPAPDFPHFDGADEQISIRGQLIQRRVQ